MYVSIGISYHMSEYNIKKLVKCELGLLTEASVIILEFCSVKALFYLLRYPYNPKHRYRTGATQKRQQWEPSVKTLTTFRRLNMF